MLKIDNFPKVLFIRKFHNQRIKYIITIKTKKHTPKNAIGIVTAASLFDGHDATINIIRRMLQSTGAEVIHLGHKRSIQEIVDSAIQEDVQAIAIKENDKETISRDEIYDFLNSETKRNKNGI